eukprot:346184_1
MALAKQQNKNLAQNIYDVVGESVVDDIYKTSFDRAFGDGVEDPDQFGRDFKYYMKQGYKNKVYPKFKRGVQKSVAKWIAKEFGENAVKQVLKQTGKELMSAIAVDCFGGFGFGTAFTIGKQAWNVIKAVHKGKKAEEKLEKVQNQ